MLVFLSWPQFRFISNDEFQIVFPTEKPQFVDKIHEFFRSQNLFNPGYEPNRIDLTVNESFSPDENGQPITFFTFKNCSKVLPEAVLNYIMTY